jgi:transaldolase
MPRETINDMQDHGHVENTLERDVDGARVTLEGFARAGVDYDDVVAVLEREGVEKFANSFKELLDGVAAKREQFVAA